MATTISFVVGKGSISHNNRTFIAENVVEERIELDEFYIQRPLKEVYDELFGQAVEEYNARQKRKDRKIDDYISKIKNSKNNEKVFYENVVQIGRMTDFGVVDEEGKITENALLAKEVLSEYARTFQERNPNLILFNAVLHMDEATPHLHLDYIPVAHGYKTGLKTRNSLSKGLQEMGIAPAKSKKDNETVHWQERERAYIEDLCKAREIEIERLGVERDSYSIPEYKQAMREKEAAEAEIEILHSEKAEVEAEISEIDQQRDAGQKEIANQQALLNQINAQMHEARRRAAEKEKEMDKILSASKPVEKEIKEIKSKVTEVPNFFGNEQMVKLPKKTFDRMVTRYRVAGTFENLSKKYESDLNAKQKTIDKLNGQIKTLKTKIKQCTEFLKAHGLLETFREFIRPKTIHEQLEMYQKEAAEYNAKINMHELNRKKHRDIAI